MISPERLAIQQQLWVRLLDRVGVEPVAAYPLFDRLVEAYESPIRHYHNLEHITEMLKVVGKLQDLIENLPALQLAVWFHDAIYDPQAKDNEERSAQLAIQELSDLGLSAGLVQSIAKMILATAHFTGNDSEGDTAILLDADLAILGADPKRYTKYAVGIRQEYGHVPDAEYRKGRIDVLQAFLNRDRIYRTDRLHAVGDALARQNLQSEILQLQTM